VQSLYKENFVKTFALLSLLLSFNVSALTIEQMRENTRKLLKELPEDSIYLMPLERQEIQSRIVIIKQTDSYGNPTKDGLTFTIKETKR
jgi:hypothetical protein